MAQNTREIEQIISAIQASCPHDGIRDLHSGKLGDRWITITVCRK